MWENTLKFANKISTANLMHIIIYAYDPIWDNLITQPVSTFYLFSSCDQQSPPEIIHFGVGIWENTV